MKDWIKGLPVVGQLLIRVSRVARRAPGNRATAFEGTHAYWESRYGTGGNSGSGSYGELARFKAGVLNDFVDSHAVRDVIEFGCGDGNQLAMANYPVYIGYDVSETALGLCRTRFEGDESKSFALLDDYDGQTADLVLSLDVIYHLVEDTTFESYMRLLFAASRRYVVIYSSDSDDNEAFRGTWIRQWRFTEWVAEHAGDWELVQRIVNPYPLDFEAQTGSWSDFFIYQRRS